MTERQKFKIKWYRKGREDGMNTLRRELAELLRAREVSRVGGR